MAVGFGAGFAREPAEVMFSLLIRYGFGVRESCARVDGRELVEGAAGF